MLNDLEMIKYDVNLKYSSTEIADKISNLFNLPVP